MRQISASRFLLGASLLLAASHAQAFVAVDGDDELFATGTASAQANDNIFLSHTNAKSDMVFDLTPGLEFDYGKNSLLKGLISASEDAQLYGSESKLNTGLANTLVTADYSDDKTKINFDASFRQADQATRDVRQVGVLVKRDLYHVEGLGEVALTDKTSLGAGAIYDDTNYLRTGYTDWEWFKVPLKYYYKMEPKLDVSAGFSYQDNQLGTGGINSNQYFYNVGARGEFTPKLTGELSVGYEEISFARGGNHGGLGVESSFNYAYSPSTTVSFGANNDFCYSAAGGASYRISGLNAGLSSLVAEQWKIAGQVGYSHYTYITTPQRDDFYSGQAGVTYILNVHTNLTAAYNYVEDSSNITPDSFTNNIFSLSASLRF